MKYRTLGKTGISVSALGFGAMRLPTTGREADVDDPRAIEMIRYAVDHGVNYVDTAYVYHGGRGEGVVGRALADGYRDRILLATKLPIWSVTSLADCDRILNEQLARLATDRIDCYLLHCVQKTTWARMQQLGVLDWLQRARDDGRIRLIGFSFHDRFDVFCEVVDALDWSLCQIQYNYVCEDVQAGTQGLRYAAAKGLGVVVMEPLFGGTLASPPPPVQAVWDTAGYAAGPVDLALQWVWNQPEVSLALSGMSTLDQVRHNVASAARSGVGSLSAADLELVGRLRDTYRALSPIPCTKCGYCLPCPQGVNIPLNFELSNQAAVFQGSSLGLSRNLYLMLPESERAAACTECGQCEPLCPQQIAIRPSLARVRDQFTAKPS